MPGSFLHAIAASLAAAAAVLLAGAITDGRSLIEADLDGVYGMGLYHDTNGHQWPDSKHGAYGCSELKRTGQGAAGTAIFAMIMTGLSVFFHTLGASAENGQRCLSITTVCLNILAMLAFVASSVLVGLFYTKEFCNVKVKDHFSLNYGMYVLVFGSVVMTVCSVLSLVAACSRPAEPEAAPVAEHNQEMRPHPVPTVPVYAANPAYPAYPNGAAYPNNAPYPPANCPA
eukprot:Rhum_TRINITY_DN14988_c0_g1::Rhum_TRINITY_DN14988_c0_g1_i1::g.131376::m.131376